MPKRKRRGEIGSAFRMAARKLVRRALGIPAAAYHRAALYLADTLDWLNLWHDNGENLTEDTQTGPRDHLYPQP